MHVGKYSKFYITTYSLRRRHLLKIMILPWIILYGVRTLYLVFNKAEGVTIINEIQLEWKWHSLISYLSFLETRIVVWGPRGETRFLSPRTPMSFVDLILTKGTSSLVYQNTDHPARGRDLLILILQ